MLDNNDTDASDPKIIRIYQLEGALAAVRSNLAEQDRCVTEALEANERLRHAAEAADAEWESALHRIERMRPLETLLPVVQAHATSGCANPDDCLICGCYRAYREATDA